MTGGELPEDSAPLGPARLLHDLLERRHSCRSFRPDPVPDPEIDQVLAAAQRTASWCNVQPWETALVCGAELERFRSALQEHAAHHAPAPDLAPPRYSAVHLERRRESGYALYAALGIDRADHPARAAQAMENYRMFGAPHALFVAVPSALGAYGVLDCGAYVAMFLLAAEAHGLAAVPQAALAMYPDVVRAHTGLSEELHVLCGISFGYEEPGHPINSFRTARTDVGQLTYEHSLGSLSGQSRTAADACIRWWR